MEICETFGLQIPMIPRLHQSNGYIYRNLWEWGVQKYVALGGGDTVLNSAEPQTTPFDVGQYRAQNANERNFRPANPNGTAFAPNQWSYQKETTGMESSNSTALAPK